MKQLLIGLFFLLVGIYTMGQSPIDNTPPYKKNPTLPAFKILQTDSTWLTNKDLPAYDYTTIIYFSPDCGHCQHEAKEMVANIDSLQNTLFIWISYREFADIKAFYKKYSLALYPNMKMGREPDYSGIPTFYQIRYTPFVALYDKNKQFVKAWEMGVEIPELMEFIRKK